MRKLTLIERLLVPYEEITNPISRDAATVRACFKLILYVLVLASAIAGIVLWAT